MKRFDAKSLAAGMIIGTLGITTAFGAGGIRSASVSAMEVTLKGAALPLGKSPVWITMDDEQEASLYVPADELLVQLGYEVHYDSEKNRVDLIPGSGGSHETAGDAALDGTVVMNLANHTDQKNIAESGSFRAEAHQTLTLSITSDIKGGSVDLFLFDPRGREQRITIGSEDITKEIALEKGTWQYNCSGMFTEGGNIKIVGTVK